MANAIESPLTAAAALLGGLLEEADPHEQAEEILAALESVRRSYERVEASLEARERGLVRERLTLLAGGGDDA